MIHIMLGRKTDLEGSSTEPPSTEGREKTMGQKDRNISKNPSSKWTNRQE